MTSEASSVLATTFSTSGGVSHANSMVSTFNRKSRFLARSSLLGLLSFSGGPLGKFYDKSEDRKRDFLSLSNGRGTRTWP